MVRLILLSLLLTSCHVMLPEDDELIESDVLNLEKDVIQGQINAMKKVR